MYRWRREPDLFNSKPEEFFQEPAGVSARNPPTLDPASVFEAGRLLVELHPQGDSMANDWLKIRPRLYRDPKVISMASFLDSDPAFWRWMFCGRTPDDLVIRDASHPVTGDVTVTSHRASHIVTRDVTRCVTVTGLIVTWGITRDEFKDGQRDALLKCSIDDLDQISGIPGFGRAMESVGWARASDDSPGVILPNFDEYNTSGGSSAARTREWRRRKRKKRDVTVTSRDASHPVTGDVTVTSRDAPREEKMREDDESASALSRTRAQGVGASNGTGGDPPGTTRGYDDRPVVDLSAPVILRLRKTPFGLGQPKAEALVREFGTTEDDLDAWQGWLERQRKAGAKDPERELRCRLQTVKNPSELPETAAEKRARKREEAYERYAAERGGAPG